MNEQPIQFGSDASLIGIYTPPANGAQARIACLIPNSGLIHRVGPHRFAVKLARQLAGAGVATFRFDLTGVGDSKSAAGPSNYRDQVQSDIGAAMDILQREHGIDRFVIAGICSGAVNGFWATVRDPRAVGLFMYDGFWYRSRWTTPVRHWKRMRSMTLPEIVGAIGRRLAGLAKRKPAAEGQTEPSQLFSSWDMDNPPREQFVRELQALVDRQVAVFLVYGGGVIDYYSYQDQFRHAFRGERFVDAVRCEHHPDFDHTLTSLDVQRRMITLVRDWAATVEAASVRA